MYFRARRVCTVKVKKLLRIHSEKEKKVLPLGSLNMYHRVYQRRKTKKFVLPVEEFNED